MDDALANHAVEEADRLGDRCAQLEDLLAQVLEYGLASYAPRELTLEISGALYGWDL